MSCRRAFEIDLTAFVRDASGPEWADFRAHYPVCAECAAEVRAWTELHESLRAGAPASSAAHPAEATLVTYAQTPAALAVTDRASIERHLDSCRLCADELETFRRFDFTALEPPTRRAPRAERGGRRRRMTTRVRRLVLHPAFAYAVVLLLLVPTLARELRSPPSNERSGAVPEIAATPDVPARRADSPPDRTAAALHRPRTVEEDSALETAHRRERGAANEPAEYTKALRESDADETRHERAVHADVVPPPDPGSQPSAAPPPNAGAQLAAAPSSATGTLSGSDDVAAKTAALGAGDAAPPELRDLAGRLEPPHPPDPHAGVLALRAGVSAEVSARDVGRSLTLDLAVAGAPDRVEVRIIGPEPGRELRERVDRRGAARIGIAVPADWLRPGTYTVELGPAERDAAAADTVQRRPASPDTAARAPAELTSRFTFRVR